MNLSSEYLAIFLAAGVIVPVVLAVAFSSGQFDIDRLDLQVSAEARRLSQSGDVLLSYSLHNIGNVDISGLSVSTPSDLAVDQPGASLPAGRSSGLISGIVDGAEGATHITLIVDASGTDGSTIVRTKVVEIR